MKEPAISDMNDTGIARDGIDPSDRFSVEPPGRWITGFKSAPPGPSAPAADAPSDQLLIDRQLFPKKHAHYLRHARRANDDAGARALSQVSLDFDPAVERLAVHSVRVWRAGEPSEHAELAKFELVQRGTEPGRQIGGGRMSAVLLLDDVRAGDVVDVASTRVTDQAQLAGQFHAAISAAYPVPVQRWSVSALVAQPSPLRWKFAPEGDEPDTREVKAGWVLHRWKKSPAPALEIEPNTPGWHRQEPVLELTEFEDWAQVARSIAESWGTAAPGGELKDIARAIAEAGGDEVARADAAIACVREKIGDIDCATGLALLPPATPAEVLQRGFGDSKDKSRLLCVLLRLLKIPASPMLVNTAAGRAIAEMLPTPDAFDRVIVGAKIGGELVWIDPTQNGLAQTAAELPPPDYGSALQVSPKAKGLTTIPAPPKDAALLVVKEHYTVSDPDQPVRLDIVRRASGVESERLRALCGSPEDTAWRERRETQMREIYPGARATGDWSIEAADAGDGLTVGEQFEIDDFAPEGEGGARAVPFGPSSVHDHFPGAPEEPERRAPWALPYPCRVRHEVRFDLPFAVAAENEAQHIDSETFGFKSQVGLDGQTLSAVYRYWSKADHVRPDQLEAFRLDAERMADASSGSFDLAEVDDALMAAPPSRTPLEEEHVDRHRHIRHVHRTKPGTVRKLVATVAIIGLVIALFVMNRDPEKQGYQGPGGQNPNAPGNGMGSLPGAGSTPSASNAGSGLINVPDLPPPARPAGARDDGFKPLFGSPEDKELPAFQGSLLDPSAPAEPKSEVEEKYPSLDLKF